MHAAIAATRTNSLFKANAATDALIDTTQDALDALKHEESREGGGSAAAVAACMVACTTAIDNAKASAANTDSMHAAAKGCRVVCVCVCTNKRMKSTPGLFEHARVCRHARSNSSDLLSE